MGANRIRHYEKLLKNGGLEDFLKLATLGQLIGFLKFLKKEERPLDGELEKRVKTMILHQLLDQHRLVDHREHQDMIAYLGQVGFQIAHLKTGKGDMTSRKVSIERKEDDLMPSLFDGRRLRQLSAMREEAEFSFLIITKSFEDVKAGILERDISERILYGLIASLCAVGYPPIFIADKYDASQIVHRLVTKIEDDAHGLYVPRPKKASSEDYRNALIEALPSVGAKTRRKLVEAFPTLVELAGASVADLEEVEGIGTKKAQRIYDVFHS